MSDVNPDSKDESKGGKTEGVNFSERYSDVMGKVNESLSKIDWTQMGKYGKAAGIIAVVVLAQVLIKVVIDTVNFFPILPGLLEQMSENSSQNVKELADDKNIENSSELDKNSESSKKEDLSYKNEEIPSADSSSSRNNDFDNAGIRTCRRIKGRTEQCMK